MLKAIAGTFAAAGLVACIAVPVAFFHGAVTEPAFQWVFALGSIVWFISATVFASRR